jgi:hypothetical protein
MLLDDERRPFSVACGGGGQDLGECCGHDVLQVLRMRLIVFATANLAHACGLFGFE